MDVVKDFVFSLKIYNDFIFFIITFGEIAENLKIA